MPIWSAANERFPVTYVPPYAVHPPLPPQPPLWLRTAPQYPFLPQNIDPRYLHDIIGSIRYTPWLIDQLYSGRLQSHPLYRVNDQNIFTATQNLYPNQMTTFGPSLAAGPYIDSAEYQNPQLRPYLPSGNFGIFYPKENHAGDINNYMNSLEHRNSNVHRYSPSGKYGIFDPAQNHKGLSNDYVKSRSSSHSERGKTDATDDISQHFSAFKQTSDDDEWNSNGWSPKANIPDVAKLAHLQWVVLSTVHCLHYSHVFCRHASNDILEPASISYNSGSNHTSIKPEQSEKSSRRYKRNASPASQENGISENVILINIRNNH